MSDDVFSLVEEALRKGGPEAGLDLLADRFLAEKRYPQLFETRLMKKRHELGLPLLTSELPEDFPPGPRKEYEEAFIAAAREVGGLFLENAEIERAWPYFRALGDPAPVAAAIDKIEPGEGLERIIEIALHERVHPQKGFELVLGYYGICRAISFYEQYQDSQTRPECLRILVKTLHSDLVASLKRAIASVEGTAPETDSVSELIAGRDWLFGDNNYYVDTSHLIAILRYSLDLQKPEMIRLAVEAADYGMHLAPMFHYKVDAPFEKVYEDHAIYLRALLGEQVEEAIAHFRRKVAESGAETVGNAPAQVLVGLLTRVGRYEEAAEVFLEQLANVEPAMLACPTAMDLYRTAGAWHRLRDLAREREDALSYLAAIAGERAEEAAPAGARRGD